MAEQVLVIRNEPRENPGIIEVLLKEHKLSYLIVDFDDSTIIGPVSKYSALVVLGGPDSANDPTPKMKNELELIREAVGLGIPYLGICLGMQTLVKALGGNVIKCKESEVGFRDPGNQLYKINLTPEGRKDPLFRNLPDTFTVFQLHGETVELTPQMTLLAVGTYCKNQIVKAGDTAYGIQSHFELTMELLESWIIEDQDLNKLNPDHLLADFGLIRKNYNQTGRHLFENFLRLAGLI